MKRSKQYATERGDEVLVTLFTTLDPNMDTLKVEAQLNTLKSFRHLGTRVRGIIFTDSDFWRRKASSYGIIVLNTTGNIYGTPLLKHMYRTAMKKSVSRFYCYLNGDILMASDFLNTLDSLDIAMQRGIIKSRVLAVGKRYNYDLKYSDALPPPTAAQHAEVLEQYEVLHTTMASSAVPFRSDAQDYFVVSADAFDWREMPSFVIGRLGYDNCLVNMALLDVEMDLVDITRTTRAVHQTGSDGNMAGHKSTWDKGWNLNPKLCPRKKDGQTDKAAFSSHYSPENHIYFGFRPFRTYTFSTAMATIPPPRHAYDSNIYLQNLLDLLFV